LRRKEVVLWYPGVAIRVGQWWIKQAQVAVDPEMEKAVMVRGPYPSLGSPGLHKTAEPEPTAGIMIESNTIETGSSFMVVGSYFKPNQKVWVDIKFRESYSVQVYCQADEMGKIHPIIEVPENTAPGDYEVKISSGESGKTVTDHSYCPYPITKDKNFMSQREAPPLLKQIPLPLKRKGNKGIG